MKRLAFEGFRGEIELLRNMIVKITHSKRYLSQTKY